MNRAMAAESSKPRQSSQPPEIIVVDDVPDLVRVYRKFFEMAGLTVIASFYSGSDLLEFFSKLGENGDDDCSHTKVQADSAIVLIDLEMPEMDGLQTAKRLRRMYPEQKIIILTTGEKNFRSSSFRLEHEGDRLFDELLVKPFTIKELLEVITSLPPAKGQILQGSRVIDDAEEIQRLKVDVLSSARERLCFCGDSYSPATRILGPNYEPIYVAVRAKGVGMQCITEITNANLYYCKQLMTQLGIQLRHLEGVGVNFTLVDGKQYFAASVISENTKITKQAFYSNVEPVVAHNQYLFDTLWRKAIPGEHKIQELEAGNSASKEVTLVSGTQENTRARIRLVHNTRRLLDACYDSDIASNLFLPEIKEAYIEAINNRGVRSRHITDITRENLGTCKELIRIGIELRHLPGVTGGFAVNEVEFDAKAASADGETKEQSVYSNYPLFVEQHRSIFNTLWNVAVPAASRIRELEKEGADILDQTQS